MWKIDNLCFCLLLRNFISIVVGIKNYYVWMSYYPWSSQFYILQIRTVGQHLGIVPTIIRDQELKERGFGGIYGVGQGALHPPALAVLSHEPIGATQTIAWVGKGIVYDTGGLSIKVSILLVFFIWVSMFDTTDNIGKQKTETSSFLCLGEDSNARNEKRLWRSCWNFGSFLRSRQTRYES